MSELSLDSISLWLGENPAWILLALWLTAFIESLAIAGIVVPGVAILFAIAAVAGSAETPLLMVLVATMLGAVCGDVLSFYLGHRYKQQLRGVWPISRFPDALEQGIDFFQKHGGKSVVVGRFVGPIRPVLPLVAGMLGMSPVRFILINLASAVAWAPVYILPGFLVGAALHVDPPKHWSTLIGSLALASVLLFWLFQAVSKQLQTGQAWYVALHEKLLPSPNPTQDKPLASFVLFLLSSLLFVIWTILTLDSPLGPMLNQYWYEFAASFELPLLRQGFILITALGDEHFLEAIFTVAVLCLLGAKKFDAAVLLALAGIATSILTHALKAHFAIARPDLLLQVPESFAYPSGHSSGAMVFYGMLATLFAERMTPEKRWRLYGIMLVPPFLIALSRTILGVHWFCDVVGGLLCGLMICSLTRLAYWWLHPKFRKVSAVEGQAPLVFGLMGSENDRERWLAPALAATIILAGIIYLLLSYDTQFNAYAMQA